MHWKRRRKTIKTEEEHTAHQKETKKEIKGR
jgi:hypothetical protein